MAKKIEIFGDDQGNVVVGSLLKNGKPSADSRILEENEIVGIFSHFLAKKCKENQRDNVIFVNEDNEPFLFAKFIMEDQKVEDNE